MSGTTPAAGEPEDDGVFDQLEEVVDVVLGEDLAPEEPESPWERRQRLLDSWTAIILAVAAVAAAWASFQASQWSGAQSDSQSASAIARADSGRAATAATADTILDSQMWLSWVQAVAGRDERKAAFLSARFSPQLAAAQKEWLTGVQLDSQGVPVVVPQGTPLDLPAYVVPKQVESDRDAALAEAQLASADVAASISTKFVLLAVLIALVLFFASVATKFTGPKLQVLLTLTALALLVVSVIRMMVLPQYITSRPDDPVPAAAAMVGSSTTVTPARV
jgi:hypothetical protein